MDIASPAQVPQHANLGGVVRHNNRGKRKISASTSQGQTFQQDVTTIDGGGPSRRRKERDPNWSKEEIMALVEAKRLEHLEEMEVIDARDLMFTDVTKWGKIALEVNAISWGEVVREGPACKHKWQSTMSDFKRIVDYHKGTGRNEEEYFLLTFADRRKQNLSRSFFREVYSSMFEFLMTRPMMNPPHSRDLLQCHDANYGADNSGLGIDLDVNDDDNFFDSQPESFNYSDNIDNSPDIRESSPNVSH